MPVNFVILFRPWTDFINFIAESPPLRKLGSAFGVLVEPLLYIVYISLINWLQFFILNFGIEANFISNFQIREFQFEF